jgi:hypothetical protein
VSETRSAQGAPIAVAGKGYDPALLTIPEPNQIVNTFKVLLADAASISAAGTRLSRRISRQNWQMLRRNEFFDFRQPITDL